MIEQNLLSEFLKLYTRNSSVIIYSGEFRDMPDCEVVDVKLLNCFSVLKQHDSYTVLGDIRSHLTVNGVISSYAYIGDVDMTAIKEELRRYIDYMRFNEFRQLLEDGFDDGVDIHSKVKDEPYELMVNIEKKLANIKDRKSVV